MFVGLAGSPAQDSFAAGLSIKVCRKKGVMNTPFQRNLASLSFKWMGMLSLTTLLSVSSSTVFSADVAVAVASPFAREQANAFWPAFRGPLGNGIVPSVNGCDPRGLPMSWSESENVTWKTAIHGKAWSTPAIWENQIWMTTATEDGTEMYAICVDRTSGEILLDHLLWEVENPRPLGNPVNTYASPSPVIQPGRVFLHFGSYGTACIDTQTFQTLWVRQDLPCNHFRGPGSSPFLVGDLLVLTMDGVDYQYLVALDQATGETVWKTDRSTDFKDLDAEGNPKADGDFRKAYTTPTLIYNHGKMQMISPGSRAAFAYDPWTGEELWGVTYGGFSNASMVGVSDDLIAVFNTGYGKPDLEAYQLTADAKGDLTKSHYLWTQSRGAPKRSSPVIVDGLLYMVNDGGVATCVEMKTGEILWSERLGDPHTGSPVYADEHLFFFGENGETTILKPGREFQVVGKNQLEDGMMASPAVAGSEWYLRGKSFLYRIEKF